MSRKTLIWTVEGTKGRDEGKSFFITEMSATEGEWFAIRAGLAMAKNGVEVPDNISELGMVGLAKTGLGMIAKIPQDEAKPLLEELMGCVQYIPDVKNLNIVRPLIETDIEEITTRLKLRAEVFKLHVDFFRNAAS